MAMTHPMSHRNRHDPSSSLELHPHVTAFDYRRAFGNYLQTCRLSRPASLGGPMTQEELSMVMGISPSGVSAIESGRNSLPPEKLEVVAKTLGVDLVAFTKVYLRWSNPWAFRILFAPDDRRIANELRNIPDRAGLDVFKGTRRNPRSRSH